MNKVQRKSDGKTFVVYGCKIAETCGLSGICPTVFYIYDSYWTWQDSDKFIPNESAISCTLEEDK